MCSAGWTFNLVEEGLDVGQNKELPATYEAANGGMWGKCSVITTALGGNAECEYSLGCVFVPWAQHDGCKVFL